MGGARPSVSSRCRAGVAFTESLGTGTGFGGGGNFSLIYSNATHAQQYAGWFTGVSATVPTPIGAISGDYQTGLDRNNNNINVVGLGYGEGISIPGFNPLFDELAVPKWLQGAHGNATYTWVQGPE
jgi:hypothetical protein